MTKGEIWIVFGFWLPTCMTLLWLTDGDVRVLGWPFLIMLATGCPGGGLPVELRRAIGVVTAFTVLAEVVMITGALCRR